MFFIVQGNQRTDRHGRWTNVFFLQNCRLIKTNVAFLDAYPSLQKLYRCWGRRGQPPRLRQIYDIHMGLLIIYFRPGFSLEGQKKNEQRKEKLMMALVGSQ
jgi:hypothetical protein